MFFYLLNVKAGQPYATLAIWVSGKLPEGAVKKSRTPFARQPQEKLPWLWLRNWSDLAAEAKVGDELLVVLIALALDVIKELAALGNHFQEPAA